MEKKGKDIYITSKARQLLGLVPEDLKKPELTASWELKLGKIARGELKQEAFLSSIRGYTEELISEIKTADGILPPREHYRQEMPALRQISSGSQRKEQ